MMTHYFQAPQKSKCVRSVSSKQLLPRKRPGKGMKKIIPISRRSYDLLELPKLSKQPSLQLDPEGHPHLSPATALHSHAASTYLITSASPAQSKAGGPPGCPCWRRLPRGAAHSLPSMHCEAWVCVLFCYRGIPGCVSLDCNINIVQLQAP